MLQPSSAVTVLIAHFTNVSARRVTVPRPHGNNAADLVVVRQTGEAVTQLPQQRCVESVFLLRSVQREPGNSLLFVDFLQNNFVLSHFSSPYGVIPFIKLYQQATVS